MSKQLQNSNVLVTGGAGFIGSHLVEKLLNLGVQSITIIDNLSTGSLDNLNNVWDDTRLMFSEELVQNIRIDTFKCKFDYIFHLAAEVSVPKSFESPSDTYHENVSGFNEVLCYAQKIGAKLIYASSSAVYGNRPLDESIHESAPLIPISPYGISKEINEVFAKKHAKLFNQTSVGLRFFNVYGSRQRADSPYSGVISIFNSLMKSGITPKIYGDGNQTRDFVHVSDIVNALIKSLESEEGKASVYNVGNGYGTSINDLYTSIASLNKHPHPPIYKKRREGDIKQSIANVEKIKSELNWSAETKLFYGLKNL